jgi:hypothetical protein
MTNTPHDPWRELRGGPMDPGPELGARLYGAMAEEYAQHVDAQAQAALAGVGYVPADPCPRRWCRGYLAHTTVRHWLGWWSPELSWAAAVGAVGGVLVGLWFR